ncbi:MAG: hypothetical protein NVS9B11_21410 [Candidatus Dormibacteraceae bacterium]
MRLFGSLLAAVLVLGACSTAAPASATPAPVGASPSVASSAALSAASSAAVAPFAAFLSTTLTDVRSGERFTLADFKGKVTIVEGMAVW